MASSRACGGGGECSNGPRSWRSSTGSSLRIATAEPLPPQRAPSGARFFVPAFSAMSELAPSYRAPAWLPGGHLQTIYPRLLALPQVRYRRERWETPDGDFIDLDWTDEDRGARSEEHAASATTPLVVLFHGLEGSSNSHYAAAL